jgi:hypothetical protein
MRVNIALDPDERAEFRTLREWPGVAWSFWRRVCERRGLDYRTLVAFTALPSGHGKHWCWPSLLELPSAPPWLVKDLRHG